MMSGMIIIPFALLVKITTPRLDASVAVTNALKSPLSPQCQKARPLGVVARPIPSPQEMVSDTFSGALPRQVLQWESTADCDLSICRAVSVFRPVPFITAIANFA